MAAGTWAAVDRGGVTVDVDATVSKFKMNVLLCPFDVKTSVASRNGFRPSKSMLWSVGREG